MKLTKKLISRLLEAAILSEGKPVSAEKLRKLLPRGQWPPLGEVRAVLDDLVKHYQNRGVQLVEVASGYRFQVAEDISELLLDKVEEKPMRMSKAFMETLALIAYRQPITRGEIEDIRGVAVSTNITKSLLELEWIREVGHKDVPGKPALFATSKKFLDHFNLQSLEDLPPLAQLQELSENKMKEEFQQLNLELENEMTEEERARAQEIRLAQEATRSPDFIGPRLPETDVDDEAQEPISFEEALEAVKALGNKENVDVAEVVEDTPEQVELKDKAEAEEQDEPSIIDATLSHLRQVQQDPDAVESELSEESVQVENDESAKNHRSLDAFSDIVISQSEEDDKPEVSGDDG